MSDNDSATWLDLLETSCAQLSVSAVSIIFDQSGCEMPLLSSVLAVEPPMPWHSLFAGLPEAGAEELSPLLVSVDLQQPLQLQWLIGLLDELDHSQLLVLASPWPFQTLAEHLGRCVEAVTDRHSGLLRYYDPRLFPLLFSHVLEPDQQQRFLQPALFWSWRNRDGLPEWLLGEGDALAVDVNISPLELSDRQMDVFACASDATVALDELTDAFAGDWGAEQRFQACFAAMLEATDAGLISGAERKAHVLDSVSQIRLDSSDDKRR